MDRRLPPSFRSTSDASPSRGDRASTSFADRRSYNRPWHGSPGGGGAAAQSPSRAKYSSLRSSSPVSPPSPSAASSTALAGNVSQTTTTASSAASPSSSRYNGVDTTTTIDGTGGSVAAGLSSYERYRSLRSHAGGPPVGSTPLSGSAKDSMDVQTRAANLLNANTTPPLTSGGTGSRTTTPTGGRGRAPSPRGRTTPVNDPRSSSPRDLRKQRLQQQYKSRGTSPFRSQSPSMMMEPPASPHHRQPPPPAPPTAPSGSPYQRRLSAGQEPSLPTTTTTTSDRNEEWLNHIRSANAAAAAQNQQSKEKRVKKSKKSSSTSHHRSVSKGEDSDDGGVKKTSSHHRRTSSRVVEELHNNGGAGVTAAPVAEDQKKTKKKKKSSKSSSGKSSSTSRRHSSKKMQESSSGDDDSTGGDSNERRTRGHSAVEEPAVQAALSKLSQASKPAMETTEKQQRRPPQKTASGTTADMVEAAARRPRQPLRATASSGSSVLLEAATSATRSLSAHQRSSVEPTTPLSVAKPSVGAVNKSLSVDTRQPSPSPKDEHGPSTIGGGGAGWSTYRSRRQPAAARESPGGGSNPFVSRSSADASKVSQYLNMRKSITAPRSGSATSEKLAAVPSLVENGGSVPEQQPHESGSTHSRTQSATAAAPNTSLANYYGMSETTDGEESEEEASSSSSGEEPVDENAPEWSVRVCVVSAIDLPPNVVPTVPFSPVLKVGLVPMKNKKQQQGSDEEPSVLNSQANNKTDILAQRAQAELKQSIHVSGLTSVSKARVRSTRPKVMSKRDNGSVEFHEEMRWDANQSPEQMAFAIELSTRAVMAPSNHKESPYEQTVKALEFAASSRQSVSSELSVGSASSGGDGASRKNLRGLFRRGVGTRPSSEMEVANAAAAVAKQLVDGEAAEEGEGARVSGTTPTPPPSVPTPTATNQSSSEINVKLLNKETRKRKPRMTDDIRLGSQIIPLSKLAWRKALENKEPARIEQWFELETAAGGSPGAKFAGKSSRNPSVLLEISFSAPEVLDDSEDDVEEESDEKRVREPRKNTSFSRRASINIRSQLRKEVQMQQVKKKEEEPVLEPGVIDYVCAVGARNIGDQKDDDGASGWVNTTPESCILEQFPPNPEYHAENGRNVALPDKVEWFCFPEGCRLWRGTTPPNSEELNLVRFSASSPANSATTIASFDACLRCTTSFSWFVLASNSDEYGSANSKTFGACIRFFVPAPTGIDPTQDDFGQSVRGAALNDKASKRLWVPVAICMTSQLAIVGAMEVMLLRMCEALSSMVEGASIGNISHFFANIASLVINYQRPIPGVVSCSVPFLSGDDLTLSLPPTNSLPTLPHGASVTSACRLLGANGINYLLSAMLTECKILLHSDDIANLSLVGEVMTALMYPFQWSLPYVPVLPVPMMEFIEAPLSYLLGVPSSSMKLVNSEYLEDVVVIDLDRDFSQAGLVDDAGRSTTTKRKTPTPLPASTTANIQKAVLRLLRRNDDEAQNGSFAASRLTPRAEPESQVEREFRIAVALELAGLVKGYQECLTIGPSSQPMFDVDKFLQTAPILYDEQRGTSMTATRGQQILSPRSRRFVSILVSCQHFHQFLEASEQESLTFFHEVMSELEAYGSKRDPLAVKRVLSLDAQKTIDQLNSILKRSEDKIPMYKVTNPGEPRTVSEAEHEAAQASTTDFPYSLLRPILMSGKQGSQNEGVNQISLEHLVELEKNPWRYQCLLDIRLGESQDKGFVPVTEKVKLRDAIGERRYHAWKNALERMDGDDTSILSDEPSANQAVDWKELLAENGDESVTADAGSKEADPAEASKRRIAEAKNRDLLRRCLEQAHVAGMSAAEPSADPNRDLVSEAEVTLQSQSARGFLLAILKKRGSNEAAEAQRTKRRSSAGVSKLDAGAFDVLLRLGCAMLDACIEDRDYDSAYSLLKLTAGLYSTADGGETSSVFYLTERLGHHPIYADLGVWLRAKKMHLGAAAEGDDDHGEEGELTADSGETDEYEAAVATLYEMLGYGIPAEELARFASRVSEENEWFGSERGQSLLLLARRICMRRDTGSANSSQKTTSDIEMMRSASARNGLSLNDDVQNSSQESGEATKESWVEIGWVHPSAQYSSRFEKDPKRKPRESEKDEGKVRHMKRSAVTSMAYLGSSVVVTGALDGGVFMARNAFCGDDEEEDVVGVKGIHLDWGSAGSRFTGQSSSVATDGAYGVGAVSILAATQPANHSYEALQMKPGHARRKSVIDPFDEEELLTAMEGCRVVAGTTCGDLREWSVKDVLSAVFLSVRGGDGGGNAGDDRTTHRSAEGVSSSMVRGRRGGVDFAAGSSRTRLKFSLRGRALSGHRGGVSCVDVPSHVYRPDSIISGGADGLIKLWSLRSAGSGSRRTDAEPSVRGSVTEQMSSRTKTAKSGDAMSILSGHGGRILCVKTAWHGDRLLSGGADRTVRLWDLAGSGGKCLSSLSGHFGWVTCVKYWGPNTIISASTDRSIALWDARVRNAPLFTLRHHYAPISDILVGARTDPVMISAGGDGTIAAWDFRRLSDTASQSQQSQDRQCKVIRRPAGTLYLHDFSSRRQTYGPVMLTRGSSSQSKTVSCLGRDAIIREWNVQSGEVVSEHVTGHCDTVSTFAALDGDKLHDAQLESAGKHNSTGTITTSWDGTVRLRRLEKL